MLYRDTFTSDWVMQCLRIRLVILTFAKHAVTTRAHAVTVNRSSILWVLTEGCIIEGDTLLSGGSAFYSTVFLQAEHTRLGEEMMKCYKGKTSEFIKKKVLKNMCFLSWGQSHVSLRPGGPLSGSSSSESATLQPSYQFK